MTSDFDPPDRFTLDPVVDGRRIYGYLTDFEKAKVAGIERASMRLDFESDLFLTGTTDGVPTGKLLRTVLNSHPRLSMRCEDAVAFYAAYRDTHEAIADVTVGSDDKGYWYAGRLRIDDFDPTDTFISGDWRKIIKVQGYDKPLPQKWWEKVLRREPETEWVSSVYSPFKLVSLLSMNKPGFKMTDAQATFRTPNEQATN